MTYLKRWAERMRCGTGVEVGSSIDTAPPVLRGEPSSPCTSHPEAATPRQAEDKRAEALELLGWLTHFYNERAAFLEYESGHSRTEAERLAMIETKGTDAYHHWKRLG
jgi:hypothetical protein